MRPGQNKRSRGRNGGNPHHNRGPRPPHRSQTFESNGPSVKIRGNAYQVYERYVALAREAASSGDRIAAENFYQHADHYFRLMSAAGEGHGYGQGQPRPQNQGEFDAGPGGDGSEGPQPQYQPQMPPLAAHTPPPTVDEEYRSEPESPMQVERRPERQRDDELPPFITGRAD